MESVTGVADCDISVSLRIPASELLKINMVDNVPEK